MATSYTYPERIKQGLTAAPGVSGNFAVGAAVAKYKALAAAHDGATFEAVTISEGNNWEVRTDCVYDHDTLTLTRGTLSDSSSGSAINFTAAAKLSIGPSGVSAAASQTRLNALEGTQALVAAATGIAATDTANINAAITAAGIGGVINFPKNQIYLTYGWHEFLSGQHVFMNGSTLKRFDQKSSLLTSTVSNGGTTCTVVDASQFAVGMIVAATVDDGVVGAYGVTANWTLSTKVTGVNTGTNTITVSPAFSGAQSGGSIKALSAANGAKLVTCGPLIRTGYTNGSGAAWASLPTDIVIEDGLINGNKANNALGRWWNLSPTMQLAMHYGQVRGMHFLNSMSDELVYSGIGNKIHQNTSREASGNFSHPSSWDGTNGVLDAIIDGNTIINCTRDTTIGHSDGALIHSNDNKGLIYSNNTVDGSNQWGCGSGFNNEDSQAVYVGNIIRNCLNGAFRANGGVDFVFTGNICVDNGQDAGPASLQISAIETGTVRAAITNNTFNNSPMIVRAGGGGDPDNIVISGNTFTGTAARTTNWKLAHIWLNGVGNCIISGNSFTGGVASTSWDGILVSSGSDNALITGNRFVNGRAGIRINTAGFTGISIKDNEFIDQYDSAVSQDVAGAYKQLTISGNDVTLSSGATIAGTWNGIYVTSSATAGHEPALVANNSVRSEKTSGTQRGIYLSGTQRATITNNRVRTSHTGAPTVDASAVVGADVILLDNECTNGTAVGVGANLASATKVHSVTDTNRLMTIA